MSDLAQRFNYHPATTQERRDAHEEVRNASLALATDIDRFVPEGRERALAITKIEEAMFWANAGIARQPAEAPKLRVGARVRYTGTAYEGADLGEVREAPGSEGSELWEVDFGDSDGPLACFAFELGVTE